MFDMGSQGKLAPHEVDDAAGFVALLRQLKDRSGLTYRQLEQRAADNGEVLARSTLASVLGNKTAPRPELLAAFVRACGEGDRAGVWMQAWEEVAGRAAASPRVREPARGALGGAAAVWVWISLAAVVLLALTGWALAAADTGADDARNPTSAAAGVGPPLPQGPVRIRPVLAEQLCLTDGPVPSHDALVAVQRPCGEVAPQVTRLKPLDNGAFRIEWQHPDHGTGCLNALAGNAATAGLLEPWEACEQTSRFRLERSRSEADDHYVIRVDGRGCVGIRDSATTEGADAVVEPCRDEKSQVFIIGTPR